MIIVHDINVIKTHDFEHYHKIDHFGEHPPVLGIYEDQEDFIKVTTETVRGRRFINSDGIGVVIGWDNQAQKLLGLPFRVFETMERRRISDYKENELLRTKLRGLDEMTLFQFIKNKMIKKPGLRNVGKSVSN